MYTDNTCKFFEIRYFFLGIILGLCCFTGKISADERKMYKYRRRMGNHFSVKLRKENKQVKETWSPVFEKSFQVPFSCTIWLRATVTARHRHLAVKHSDELVCMIQTEKLTSLTEPVSRMGEAAKAWCGVGGGALAPNVVCPGVLQQMCFFAQCQALTWGKYCGKQDPVCMTSLLASTHQPPQVRAKLTNWVQVDFLMTFFRDRLEL